LAISTLTSKSHLFDLSSGELLSDYSGAHKSDQYHSSVKFSPCQSYLIQASEDHTVVLYDIVSKQCLKKLDGHKRPVVTLDRAPVNEGGQVFASGSADGSINIWGN
jgi:WD40 repeat protein